MSSAGPPCLQSLQSLQSPLSLKEKTPDAGFEPAANGLTVRCSTTELIRNSGWRFLAKAPLCLKRVQN